MNNGCLLRDAAFMIINGAQNGVAGFGLARDPNLSALLYDPPQPVGSRILILNNTTIPRMYRFEATLLPDDRVLLLGSDPQTSGLLGFCLHRHCAAKCIGFASSMAPTFRP
jgi:hypothetical protein